MKLLPPRKSDRVIELADGTLTIDQVAEITGYTASQIRVILYQGRKEGLELPMRRKQTLKPHQKEDYNFIAERLLEGWTMAQIARYMKRNEKQLERYFELLRGNV